MAIRFSSPDVAKNLTSHSYDIYYKMQSKKEKITKNGVYTYTPDEGYNCISDIEIEVAIPYQHKDVTITKNNTTTEVKPTGYEALSDVTVKVQIPTQTKSVEYKNNGTFTIKPDNGYDYLEQVTVTVNVPLEDTTTVIDSINVKTVTPSEGFIGIESLDIVPSTKEFYQTFTENGEFDINTGDDLYNGGKITVNVPSSTVLDLSENPEIKFGYSYFKEIPD